MQFFWSVALARQRQFVRHRSARGNATPEPISMTRLTLTRPDDWYLHLCDGETLAALPASSRLSYISIM